MAREARFGHGEDRRMPPKAAQLRSLVPRSRSGRRSPVRRIARRCRLVRSKLGLLHLAASVSPRLWSPDPTKSWLFRYLAPILMRPSVQARPPMAERPACAPAFEQGRLPWLRASPSTLPERSSAVGSATLTSLQHAWLKTTIMSATGFARSARVTHRSVLWPPNIAARASSTVTGCAAPAATSGSPCFTSLPEASTARLPRVATFRAPLPVGHLSKMPPLTNKE